jgi:hypothetical protein
VLVANHYSHYIRLPWIIELDELRPDTSRIGSFPRNPLWVTPNDAGRSSAMGPSVGAVWRSGLFLLVRIKRTVSDRKLLARICREWTGAHMANRSKRPQMPRDTVAG